jgi:hypothetical protein
VLVGPDGAPEGRSGGAALRYAVAWLAAGAVVVVGLVAVLGTGGDGGSLPPIQQIPLERAAQVANCTLRAGPETARLNPPADGRAGAPAPPGTYDRPLPTADAIGALRQGLVVIQYRREVSADAVERLEALRAAVPPGTILAPNGTSMPYEVAATAWRRLLGCPRLDAAALDAVRLFRGRFIGTAP